MAEMVVDWREAFVRYARHVMLTEGWDFLGHEGQNGDFGGLEDDVPADWLPELAKARDEAREALSDTPPASGRG
jgi:hypothetical protein